MESSLTYEKMDGFAKIDGQQFEWNLAALLFLRGLKSDMDFQLATNVEGAGALDDVVFRFKPSTEPDAWTTVYVQLKHLETKDVTRKMLKRPKEPFCLAKYFKSYLEIKTALSNAKKGTLFDGSFEKSVFVIFTNAKASQFLGPPRCGPLCQAEDFVWCGVGQVFNFQDDEELLTGLGECGEEGSEFLGRLQLFCGQPSAYGLEGVIKSELDKVDGKMIEGVDFKSLFECFLRRMQVWWEKSNEVLHRGNDLLRLSVLEVTSQQTKNGYILDLIFEEEVLAELRDSFKGDYKIFTVQSSEISCRLSLTKLSQAFGGQSLVLDCKVLLANKEALLVQWRKKEVKSLIICTNGWDSSHQVDFLSVVKELLVISNTQPVVCLTADKSCVVEALTGEFHELFLSYDDKFQFSQLKEATQKHVLKKKLSIQGYSTTISELLDKYAGSADQVLDACSVVEIFDGVGTSDFGSPLGEGISYYVDRHLELATVVKASVFQDGALQECVTIRVIESDLENEQGSVINNKSMLFKQTINYLSSQNDISSNGYVDIVISRLSQSQLAIDPDTSEFFIGEKISFGLFECSSVGLHFGQQDEVTALWVRTSTLSAQAGFLFISDKTSENDFRKFSEFNQSKHFMSLKDGQLHWMDSHGNIESIRPHIDEDQVLTFSPEKATDVEDRLVLVCAEPGMGKSTLMTRLAKNTKEAHPDYFVFLIALNDHSVLFSQDIHKDVLGFLCRASKIESHLHRSLLKYALEVSGDVVVFFDGYDEISPKYIEQSCYLLSSLIMETKARKIWMTSRNSVKLTLEATINRFSAKLREFNRVDQENFLRKFLKRKSQLLQEDLDKFINKLIEKTSQAVRDKDKNFMGIPLQTQMLAEVYEDHVTDSAMKTELPEKLDLLMLLEQFVDNKYNIFYRDRLKILSSDTNDDFIYKKIKKGFVKSHARAALILIVGDDDAIIRRMNSVIKKTSKFFKEIRSGSYKTGFIDSIVNDKPRFLHRVFAEYFIAKWISKKFADYQELVESKMFTAEFSVIRNFFDRFLAKNHDLHTAVVNEDPEEVRSLLESKDVNEKDGGGRTPLHLAAGLGTSEDQEENKTRGEILDLLIDKTSDINQEDDVLHWSPLKYADISQSWVAVDRFLPNTNKEQFILILKDLTEHGMPDPVFGLDLHNLLGFCLDNGFAYDALREAGEIGLLFRACELGSLKVASVLLGRNPQINDVNGEYNLFLRKASANGHLEIVKLLQTSHISTLRNVLNQGVEENEPPNFTEIANYINVADKDGITAIHLAAQNGHSDAIRFLLSQGGDPIGRNQFNNTPLHLAAEFKRPEALKVLLEALDENDRAAVVNSAGYDGYSVLMNASMGGCMECVKQLVETGGKLTLVSTDGGTALMVAAFKGQQEVVRYLLENFNPENERMSLKDYVNMVDKDRGTALHFSALTGHAEVVSLLISHGGDPGIRDCENCTALHSAAEFENSETLKVILKSLDEVEQTLAVNLCDKYGNSVLTCGALGGCLESVRMIVKAGGKLTHVNLKQRTPLMEAVEGSHLPVVKYLLSVFSTEGEGMTVFDYIKMKDTDGKTALDLASAKCREILLGFRVE